MIRFSPDLKPLSSFSYLTNITPLINYGTAVLYILFVCLFLPIQLITEFKSLLGVYSITLSMKSNISDT